MKDSNESSKRKLGDIDVRQTGLGLIDLPSFDTLVELAREKPEELEQLRQRITRDVISSAPNHMQERLSGLQFQIDMERRRSSSAVSACLKISSMMNEALVDLREALSNPEEFLRNRPQHRADVLDFSSARAKKLLAD
ncbi:hypothetical protein A3742_02860 [Oleiphilus sp. HI0071]|jgi:hypothetical protein|uniref:DUF3135 domain-containing protein n=1 Tax=unclassified Oleiphilus TaxID=2631174 RepID=UPI0007C3BC50|nr:MULTISPECIES: DUF3135 domain-containing protein [unclassified Oleiphilus]KZY61084.1 hypothetical protein A3737_06360 [Oleiphilus sp. HI0065]KZY81915.1 hypothetical protein A3742_19075 [Oleiphilus sp. HI0071]KZY89702.1 hypothetical protein A3744_06010 [Oleiphilus sp. HI0073]KZZ41795.1 hypothetical protein A3758_22205 [Oleiphilus sp. HI0118]KZZ48785.1 hypothetical protein A3760_22820 [Oleiphilus sp. HI0122]KZZ67985.1 hypothetical protein A3765_00530 [Oleiphilus sp. HI0130]KZZ80561.1 hypothe